MAQNPLWIVVMDINCDVKMRWHFCQCPKLVSDTVRLLFYSIKKGKMYGSTIRFLINGNPNADACDKIVIKFVLSYAPILSQGNTLFKKSHNITNSPIGNKTCKNTTDETNQAVNAKTLCYAINIKCFQ